MLEVSKLSAAYGGIVALRDVSLRLEQGRAACVVGANGAGKSTLMNAISGLVKPTAGTISFLGEKIHGRSPQSIAHRRLLQVPEGRRVLSPLSVEDNLRVGSTPGRADRRKERELLDSVYQLFPRLFERRAQLAASLSGGEQQMLAIGRALMGQPQLLLLDEPSLGLAPVIVDQVFGALAALRLDGLTLLLVEQNARRALGISDYGYVLSRGRVVLEGSAVDLAKGDDLDEFYFDQGRART